MIKSISFRRYVVLLLSAGLAACATQPDTAKTGKSVDRPPKPAAAILHTPPVFAPPQTDGTAPVTDGQIRVGLLLPMTGPRAAIGTTFMNAAQMALFDFNDPRLVVLPRDTKGTAEGAAAAAGDALTGGAQLLLGPVFAHEVTAAAPVAQAQSRNLIGFSTDQRVAGSGVYLLSFSPEQEVYRIISYARAQGLTRIAALVPRTPYGERVAQAYQQAVSASGGGALKLVYYTSNTEDMHTAVKQLADYDLRKARLREEIARLSASTDPFAQTALAELKNRDTFGEVEFDALLLADGGASLRALAPLLQYYDVNPGTVRLLGTGLWNSAEAQKEVALNGGWFPAPPSDMSQNFRSRIQAQYGNLPTPVEGLAYDAMALAVVLVSQQTDAGAAVFTQAALTNPNGFAGILGIFRLREDGLAERGLAVMEISGGAAQQIDAAPEQFN